MRPFTLILSIGVTAISCSDDAPLSKDDVRQGKADIGTDYCEMYGWYGDGECDHFCPKPDGDCCNDNVPPNPLCDTPPICDAGLFLARQNGCFVCVHPATCEPPSPSCDDGSSPSPFCDTPPVCAEGLLLARQDGCFACVYPETCSCDDDSTLSQFCDAPPLCEEGLVRARQDSCFACVNPMTCEP
jgi:hypothetical protein